MFENWQGCTAEDERKKRIEDKEGEREREREREQKATEEKG